MLVSDVRALIHAAVKLQRGLQAMARPWHMPQAYGASNSGPSRQGQALQSRHCLIGPGYRAKACMGQQRLEADLYTMRLLRLAADPCISCVGQRRLEADLCTMRLLRLAADPFISWQQKFEADLCILRQQRLEAGPCWLASWELCIAFVPGSLGPVHAWGQGSP